MLEVINLLAQHASGNALHFIGDSAYTDVRMLGKIPDHVDVTGPDASGQGTAASQDPFLQPIKLLRMHHVGGLSA